MDIERMKAVLEKAEKAKAVNRGKQSHPPKEKKQVEVEVEVVELPPLLSPEAEAIASALIPPGTEFKSINLPGAAEVLLWEVSDRLSAKFLSSSSRDEEETVTVFEKTRNGFLFRDRKPLVLISSPPPLQETVYSDTLLRVLFTFAEKGEGVELIANYNSLEFRSENIRCEIPMSYLGCPKETKDTILFLGCVGYIPHKELLNICILQMSALPFLEEEEGLFSSLSFEETLKLRVKNGSSSEEEPFLQFELRDEGTPSISKLPSEGALELDSLSGYGLLKLLFEEVDTSRSQVLIDFRNRRGMQVNGKFIPVSRKAEAGCHFDISLKDFRIFQTLFELCMAQRGSEMPSLVFYKKGEVLVASVKAARQDVLEYAFDLDLDTASHPHPISISSVEDLMGTICPLSKEQQQKVKRVADVVQKHKDVARKLSPRHL